MISATNIIGRDVGGGMQVGRIDDESPYVVLYQ